jgi:glycosyltransferase involved in cell wall biosynthesis
MNKPAITVLMPVYNADAYLRVAIESILAQTFTDFEFLIINDGSTDDSEKIIVSFNDSRIRYIKNDTNLKLIATLNRGIDLSAGEYIARMDADDISTAERLQTQFDFMEEHAEVALCGSWFEIFGIKNEVVKYVEAHNEIMMKMLYQCHLCHPSVIMRKSMIEHFSAKFDPRFLHAEDYDFFSRVGEKFKLANIPKVLLRYRHHGNSVSSQNTITQSTNSLVIRQRLFKDIGLEVTGEEIELYRSIAQYEYKKTEEYLVQAQTLLESLVAANNQSGFFEKQFFQTYASQLWLNVMLNSSFLGPKIFCQYRSSFLSSIGTAGYWQLIKLWIKTRFSI